MSSADKAKAFLRQQRAEALAEYREALKDVRRFERRDQSAAYQQALERLAAAELRAVRLRHPR